MISHIARRLAYGAASLLALIIAVFFLARLTGNPADLYLPVDTSPELREQFSEARGFNQPVLEQFVRFVSDLAHLDFGVSSRNGEPALAIVFRGAPTTLALTGLTMASAILLGIILGALAAIRPNGIFDRVTSVLTVAGSAAPNFWIAIICILFFSIFLHLLPTSGMGGAKYWILPIVVLILRPLGILAQAVRGGMIGALSSAYVKTARAKGVPAVRIIFIHALRNCLLPVVTIAGDQAVALVNGAVIVETMFAFRGLGSLMLDAIQFRDFAVLQTAVILIAIAIFLLNALIDLIYIALDPRVRT